MRSEGVIRGGRWAEDAMQAGDDDVLKVLVSRGMRSCVQAMDAADALVSMGGQMDRRLSWGCEKREVDCWIE